MRRKRSTLWQMTVNGDIEHREHQPCTVNDTCICRSKKLHTTQLNRTTQPNVHKGLKNQKADPAMIYTLSSDLLVWIGCSSVLAFVISTIVTLSLSASFDTERPSL